MCRIMRKIIGVCSTGSVCFCRKEIILSSSNIVLNTISQSALILDYYSPSKPFYRFNRRHSNSSDNFPLGSRHRKHFTHRVVNHDRIVSQLRGFVNENQQLLSLQNGQSGRAWMLSTIICIMKKNSADAEIGNLQIDFDGGESFTLFESPLDFAEKRWKFIGNRAISCFHWNMSESINYNWHDHLSRWQALRNSSRAAFKKLSLKFPTRFSLIKSRFFD